MQAARSSPLISIESNFKASPKWSFKGKPRDNAKTDTPGPGAYSAHRADALGTETRFSKSPGYGFGNGSKDYQRPCSAPGPGRYSPGSPSGLSPKCGFGTSSRRVSNCGGDHPGPGLYKVDSGLGAGSPKYSATKKRDLLAAVDSPGPGTYRPDFTLSSSKSLDPKWGFARSPREGNRLRNNPGPGDYNIEVQGLSDLRGPRYSFRARRVDSRPESSPGPGRDGPTYTMFG